MKIFIKNIMSRIIDFIIPTITIILVYYITPTYTFKKIDFKDFIFALYLLTTFSAILISKGFTIGQILMKIKTISNKNNKIILKKTLLKEIYISLIFFLALNDFIGTLILILSYLPIKKLKNENNLLTSIDIFSGTKVTFNENTS